MSTFSHRIDAMLADHHVLSLSVSTERDHWAAPLFYVVDPPAARLVVATDPATRHGALMRQSRDAAVTISGQTEAIDRIHGLQMQVTTRTLEGSDADAAAALYHRRFPVPAQLSLTLWELRPRYIKATDNRERFGDKKEWPPAPERPTRQHP